MSKILSVNKMVPPSPACWETVIKGMRLPMYSGRKYDSQICNDTETDSQFILGEEDFKLATGLIKAGASDRKFLRQLPIVMEVTADQIFWRQCDQYKIGTTTNSSSQMHLLHKTYFTMDDFNIPRENMSPELTDTIQYWLNWINMFIKDANCMKERGNPEWKHFWDLAISMVPQSVLYTKCWSLNYETAINIGLQREGHKNPAWDILIDYWKENLPYYKEFLEASKFKQNEFKRLKQENDDLNKDINGFSIALNSCVEKDQELEARLKEVKQERDMLLLDAHAYQEENEKLKKDNDWLEACWDDEWNDEWDDEFSI